ncbi:MAG: recombinase family protein [Rhodococcus sp. (in: high G+C Gram-positive bacteria)]
MEAVIYTRVSSDRAGGRSTDEQEADCRAVCETHGWPVVEVLTDNDIGASRHSRRTRPAYEHLKEVLHPGRVLVLWEASRGQRDLKAYVELRDLCSERGVPWCYSGTIYDLATGSDRFRTGLDALLAEDEVERTRQRVMRALTANVAAGKPHGKIPFGYRAVRDEKTGTIVDRVIDESEAAVLREAACRILAGESARSIYRDFNEREIPGPTDKKWSHRTLTRLLQSPTYAGMRVHRGAVVGQGTWEPIFTEDEHLALSTLLSDSTRIVARGSAPKHLLTGIATCGVCGGSVFRLKDRGRETYVCREGFHVSRSKASTDLLVTETIIAGLEDPELVEAVRAMAGVPKKQLSEAQVLQARLDKLADDCADEKITPRSFQRMEARLLKQIADAKARARRAAVAPIVVDTVGPNARERWESYTLEKKRDLIRALVRVRLLPTGTKSGKFDPDSVSIEWIDASDV